MPTQRITRTLIALIAGAMLIVNPNATEAVTISTADGNGADSYVRLGQAGTNFGGSGNIVVKDAGTASTTRHGYLRFDISTTGGAFDDATLTFDVSTNNSSGGNPPPNAYTVNVYGLADGAAGENWGEGAINWNNAPSNDTANNRLTRPAILLGSFNVPAVSPPNSVNFTSEALAGFLNQDTDGNATIILQREGGGNGNNLAFASKENAGQPAPSLTANEVLGQVLSISTSDGVGADTYIRNGAANVNSNFGGGSSAIIKHSGNTTTRKGYLRFDLSSLTAEALHAALTLDTTINNQGGGGSTPQEFAVQVFGLLDGDGGESWDEGLITWNNAPANNTANNGLLANAVLLGTFNVEDNVSGQVMFSNQALIDFINDDSNDQATLILRRISGSGSHNLGFATKEHSTFFAPTLTIVQAVPEPATAVLGILGVAGLMLRRQRMA